MPAPTKAQKQLLAMPTEIFGPILAYVTASEHAEAHAEPNGRIYANQFTKWTIFNLKCVCPDFLINAQAAHFEHNAHRVRLEIGGRVVEDEDTGLEYVVGPPRAIVRATRCNFIEDKFFYANVRRLVFEPAEIRDDTWDLFIDKIHNVMINCRALTSVTLVHREIKDDDNDIVFGVRAKAEFEDLAKEAMRRTNDGTLIRANFKQV